VEHKFDLSGAQNVIVQAGILDNVTGEPTYGSRRLPQAGEFSGQPAYAARIGWSKNLNGRPISFGASGYYSRQNWGFDWNVDGWAAAADWRVPIASRVELSGEFYRGRAVGGLGGGIGQSVLYSGNPLDPASDFRGVNSAGGWSQLKFSATSRLEFNGAFGVDDPYAADIHAFSSPVGYYPAVLTANHSAMINFIYRPRSDLLLSAEYRRLRTSEIGVLNTADQVNLVEKRGEVVKSKAASAFCQAVPKTDGQIMGRSIDFYRDSGFPIAEETIRQGTTDIDVNGVHVCLPPGHWPNTY
jgi:hypothetical protein